jgi:general secretion pathway protein A
MYAKFFGLKQPPFSIAPDPRYLFMSERHREALAHLIYGLKGGGGFVLLTGEIGAGKTTVCRCFLEQVPPRCNVAYIFNPKLTVHELLKTVCDEFRIPLPAHGAGGGPMTIKDFIDPLNEFLLRTHGVSQTNVLIIDEAQNLSADVLEQLRLLTNLETSERKLLQIILIGQPELRQMLARPELEQLAQRVIARYHLEALSEAETGQYVSHRLGVAGLGGASPFDKVAVRRIHQLSRGVPRRINLLCDRALLGGYATGQARIGVEVIDRAAGEVFGAATAAAPGRAAGLALAGARWVPWAGGVAAGAAVVSLAAWAWWPGARSGLATAASTPAASAPPAVWPASTPSLTLDTHAVATAPNPVPAVAPIVGPTTTLAAAPAQGAAELRSAFLTQLRGEADAWRELAKGWGLSLADTPDPCGAAARQQVQCFKGASTLALVRQLDRPGIVVLHDTNERPYHVLLTALDNESATLQRGAVRMSVPLATLGTVWRGEFYTLWRTPPGYAGPASVTAAESPAHDWLLAHLAQALPADTSASSPAPTATRLMAFQVAQGLAPDGLAGPMTLMRLNRGTGVDEPRLQAPARR